MTNEEWLERYAQRIVTQARFSVEEAREIANANPIEDLNDGYEDDPEGAADEEMSCWSE